MAPLVHVIDPAMFTSAMAEKVLTSDEHYRASRFHFAADRERWAACRTALRMVLSSRLGIPPRDLLLLTERNGKPLLPPELPLAFNLSHCHDLALVVTSPTGPVGIDLEPIDRASVLDGCEATFLHPDEIAELPTGLPERHLTMLKIWTAKEAFLKALGTGLSYPPTAVKVDLEQGTANSPGLPALEDLRLHRLQHPRIQSHLAALACPANFSSPRIATFP